MSTVNSPRNAHTNAEDVWKKKEFANGLRFLSMPINSARSTVIGIWVDAGTRDESATNNGVAHFLEHLSFRATEFRSAVELSIAFESVGAFPNAFTTKDATAYYVRCMPEHAENMLRLLAEIVVTPALLEKEIIKERKVILEEIRSYEDDPEEMAFDELERLLFADNPLSRPILGTPKSLRLIDKSALLAFKKARYTPDNIVICAVGAVDNRRLTKLVEKIFHDDKSRTDPVKKPKKVPLKRHSPSSSTLKKNFQQAHALMGFRLGGIHDIDRHSLSAFNTLFGEGLSSRLYQTIREKHSLAYTVYSSLQLFTSVGMMSLYSACEAKSVEQVRSLMKEEISSLRRVAVTSAELDRAKEQMRTSVAIGMESLSQRLHTLAKNELDETHESVGQTFEAIDSITLSKVQSIAESIADPTLWSDVTILPKTR